MIRLWRAWCERRRAYLARQEVLAVKREQYALAAAWMDDHWWDWEERGYFDGR